MNTREVSKILNVSELTVRRAILNGELIATKLENGVLEIEEIDLILFMKNNKKYTTKLDNYINYIVKKNKINITPDTLTDDINKLQQQIMQTIIKNKATDMVESFNQHLTKVNDKEELPLTLKKIDNKIQLIKQPTCKKIIDILTNTLFVSTHSKIKIGEKVSGSKIEEVFGRNPKQEGINFCTSSKELFVITKIGRDNPIIELAEYNDYWNQGKIMYEGKGQEVQEMKGSNLHLYRKYQVFNKEIKCKEEVPSYIHVFNKVSNNSENRFQYLGEYNVTNYYVNEHSISMDKNDVKVAIVYEFTPISNKKSKNIDENYIF